MQVKFWGRGRDIAEVPEDCGDYEIRMIRGLAESLKATLRNNEKWKERDWKACSFAI